MSVDHTANPLENFQQQYAHFLKDFTHALDATDPQPDDCHFTKDAAVSYLLEQTINVAADDAENGIINPNKLPGAEYKLVREYYDLLDSNMDKAQPGHENERIQYLKDKTKEFFATTANLYAKSDKLEYTCLDDTEIDNLCANIRSGEETKKAFVATLQGK